MLSDLLPSRYWPAVGLSLALSLTACGVHISEKDSPQKKVDIQTPFGNMKISEQVQASDTGLSVYPGSRPAEKFSDGDNDRANVNISTSAFGLKLAVVKYESDDAPEKLLSYYRNELKKYGSVLECTRSGFHIDAHVHEKKGSEQLSCEKEGPGDYVELKVGTESNQHIVAIKPKDKGSEFALVYVRTRGSETI
jgi:hypothetical protein